MYDEIAFKEQKSAIYHNYILYWCEMDFVLL